jgi:hypothetical protein
MGSRRAASHTQVRSSRSPVRFILAGLFGKALKMAKVWTNRETEHVAEYIRNDDNGTEYSFWTNMAIYAEDTEPAESERVNGLARTVKHMFCGSPGMCTDGVFRENADQSEEVIDFSEILDVDFSLVDWKQIAEWLINKSRRSSGSSG